MEKEVEKKIDAQKELVDKKKELRDKTGVVDVTPVEGKGVSNELKTVDALLKAKGTELNDLMQRPRENADDYRKRVMSEKQEKLFFTKNTSVRIRRIPWKR